MLVDDWKSAWKFISVNCMVLVGAIQGAWIYIPEDIRASIEPTYMNALCAGLMALGVAGRLFKQKRKRK